MGASEAFYRIFDDLDGDETRIERTVRPVPTPIDAVVQASKKKHATTESDLAIPDSGSAARPEGSTQPSPRKKKKGPLLTASELIGELQKEERRITQGIFQDHSFKLLHHGRLFPVQESILRKVVKEGGQLSLLSGKDDKQSIILTTCDKTWLKIHQHDFTDGAIVLPLAWAQVCFSRNRVIPISGYNLLEPTKTCSKEVEELPKVERSTGFRKWALKTPEPETQPADRVDGNKSTVCVGLERHGSDDAQQTHDFATLLDNDESELLSDDDVLSVDNEQSIRQGESSTSGPSEVSNATIVEELQKLLSYYEATKDTFRVWAYRRSINILKRFGDRKIAQQSRHDLAKLPGIGTSVANNIAEIAARGRLTKAEIFSKRDQEVRLFMTIHGVGRTKAESFYNKGWRTLEDCRRNREALDPVTRLGLEYYDDLQVKIGRPESLAIFQCVQEAFHRLDSKTSSFLQGPMGSYRRGALESGDVDILLVGGCTEDAGGVDEAQDGSRLVKRLIDSLSQEGFITCTLASPGALEGEECKWQGIVRLSAQRIWPDVERKSDGSGHYHRRLDIHCIARESWGAASLYFTGDTLFQRSCRLLARKSGLILNQRGLYQRIGPAPMGASKAKREEQYGEFISKGWTDRQILERLGVGWREPHERNIVTQVEV